MRKLILAGVVASLLISAPVASANIEVGKSIAGISLGMTEQQVVATFGPPKKTTSSKDEITGQQVRQLEYNSALVDISNDAVILVATRSKKEKTSSGIGPGSTEKKLKKKIKGIKCSGKKLRVCAKGSGKPGTVVTAFSISKSKKVTAVFIGLVLD